MSLYYLLNLFIFMIKKVDVIDNNSENYQPFRVGK